LRRASEVCPGIGVKGIFSKQFSRLKMYGYQRKEHGMLTAGSKKGTIRFTIRPNTPPTSVQLAGDFNGWKPVPMRRGKNGAFEVEVPLSRDAHQYKFIIDGQWVLDPDTTVTVPNPYGSTNSVVLAG
jgi:1,4-alpha-glucan branching enzyme